MLLANLKQTVLSLVFILEEVFGTYFTILSGIT